MSVEKMSAPIGTLILDAGPLIANTTLPAAHAYLTTPSVLAELRDEGVRLRLQSLHGLQTRAPSRASVAFVRTFAKKTGDAEVLSAADIGIIALSYELECEANGGDWRLRNTPGQARINGAPPVREAVETDRTLTETDNRQVDDIPTEHLPAKEQQKDDTRTTDALTESVASLKVSSETNSTESPKDEPIAVPDESIELIQEEQVEAEEEEEEGEDDDDDWITPSNIKKHQEKDNNIDATAQDVKTMKVACATHDFAVQNVLLQIGLNLVSGEGKRISSVKTWVLRCHACFKVTRKMDLKFCPSCGGATLMRTSVSTDSKGAMKVHLKRNMQWNNRGTVYGISKQQHGTANMKGRDNLILRADQREVEKLEKRDRYRKEHDLLDPDHVPSIVSGRRDTTAGSVRYGHGKRNPNSNRKH